MSETTSSEHGAIRSKQMSDIRRWYGGDDFSYMVEEIKDIRLHKGSEDYDERIQDLLDHMQNRAFVAALESNPEYDEQVVIDAVHDGVNTPDDEMAQILAAA